MKYLNPTGSDAGLNVYKGANRLVYCSLPAGTSYAQVVAAMLGHKDTPTFSANENALDGEEAVIGRQFRISAVTDGVGDATGSANHYALINTSTETVLTIGELAAQIDIAAGSTVSSAEFAVRLNNPS